MSDTMTAEPAQAKRPKRAAEESRAPRQAPPSPDCSPAPCVGLPVQYRAKSGTFPGILQRPSRTVEGAWDVKVFLPELAVPTLRVAVKHADEPTEGCWNFLPGWGG